MATSEAASRRPWIILRVVGRAPPLLIRSRDPYELLPCDRPAWSIAWSPEARRAAPVFEKGGRGPNLPAVSRTASACSTGAIACRDEATGGIDHVPDGERMADVQHDAPGRSSIRRRPCANVPRRWRGSRRHRARARPASATPPTRGTRRAGRRRRTPNPISFRSPTTRRAQRDRRGRARASPASGRAPMRPPGTISWSASRVARRRACSTPSAVSPSPGTAHDAMRSRLEPANACRTRSNDSMCQRRTER